MPLTQLTTPSTPLPCLINPPPLLLTRPLQTAQPKPPSTHKTSTNMTLHQVQNLNLLLC